MIIPTTTAASKLGANNNNLLVGENMISNDILVTDPNSLISSNKLIEFEDLLKEVKEENEIINSQCEKGFTGIFFDV